MLLELILVIIPNGISKIVSKIRKIEKSLNKKISIIADLQGV